MSIRKQYDTDLESLKNSLTEMGRNSADAVENALEALCVADADAAAAIVKGDARINNMERDIEHRCMTLLLRQQPVAGDLRRISTAMKVVRMWSASATMPPISRRSSPIWSLSARRVTLL